MHRTHWNPLGLSPYFHLPTSVVTQVPCCPSLTAFYLNPHALSPVLLQSESEWCSNTLIFVDNVHEEGRRQTFGPFITFSLGQWLYFGPRQQEGSVKAGVWSSKGHGAVCCALPTYCESITASPQHPSSLGHTETHCVVSLHLRKRC